MATTYSNLDEYILSNASDKIDSDLLNQIETSSFFHK